MPMPQVIGISLACLVTCACTVTKTTDKNALARVTSSKAEIPTPTALGSSCAETNNSAYVRFAARHTRRRRLGVEAAVGVCRDAAGLCCGQLHALGNSQFGTAAWYDLVGRETASGEILDTVTATAANLSLPLESFARVTDLDNGRSVIVKINDRGPYTRGRIIDLSPRAAEMLHMKVAGVAAVVVEPIENYADQLADAFQTAGTEAAGDTQAQRVKRF